MCYKLDFKMLTELHTIKLNLKAIKSMNDYLHEDKKLLPVINQIDAIKTKAY